MENEEWWNGAFGVRRALPHVPLVRLSDSRIQTLTRYRGWKCNKKKKEKKKIKKRNQQPIIIV